MAELKNQKMAQVAGNNEKIAKMRKDEFLERQADADRRMELQE